MIIPKSIGDVFGDIFRVGIVRVEHVMSTILYMLEPPIYSRNLAHHTVIITLPTYTYISFGAMLTTKVNLLVFFCKGISKILSHFPSFIRNLGRIIKYYNTRIKKLTSSLTSVRIFLVKTSNNKVTTMPLLNITTLLRK